MATTRMSMAEFKRLTQGAATPAPAQPQALFAKHEERTIRVRFPLPNSANEHWHLVKISGEPRFALSAEGRKFRREVRRLWLEMNAGSFPEPLTGPLRLTVWIAYRTRLVIDLDNRIKPLQDAMGMHPKEKRLDDQGACIYQDDKQIRELHVYDRPPSPPDGYVEILIEALNP